MVLQPRRLRGLLRELTCLTLSILKFGKDLCLIFKGFQVLCQQVITFFLKRTFSKLIKGVDSDGPNTILTRIVNNINNSLINVIQSVLIDENTI